MIDCQAMGLPVIGPRTGWLAEHIDNDRLAERNEREDANALVVTPEALDDFFARFEAPHGEGEEIVEPDWL